MCSNTAEADARELTFDKWRGLFGWVLWVDRRCERHDRHRKVDRHFERIFKHRMVGRDREHIDEANQRGAREREHAEGPAARRGA